MSGDKRMSVADLRRMLEPQTDEDREADGLSCVECSEPYTLRDGCDPTPLCDGCAQMVISDVMPTLLDIAGAARAFRDARCSTQTEAFHEYEQDSGLCFGSIHCESCPVDIALERLRAAAGRVKP